MLVASSHVAVPNWLQPSPTTGTASDPAVAARLLGAHGLACSDLMALRVTRDEEASGQPSVASGVLPSARLSG